MEYHNEHLLPGQLGHLLVVLSFVAALLSAVSYFFAAQRRALPDADTWKNMGRFAFLLHGLSTFGVIASLFVILTGKMYEYQYAWANVSDDLPVKYVFSAFWKEQQGSFLLWSFWHIVLSIVLMLRAGKWESPVMTMIAFAETFIACMLLGLYFGDYRFGASPFDLLRDVMDAPIFAQADYLDKIKGNGLNPLLQNYWMTIHPPTLFLGFASTIVPFGYAVAGLWLREHREWLKPCLQWSLFSGAILGLGILMGGAWAYEALSFAGYWAWDPVENTSLVPWLTLVAGIHATLIARNTGYSIRSAYGFYLMTFILVLYSTYLTRSGILGDTSAHAFTEMGLGVQLVLFIAVFSLLGLWLFFSRWKSVPDVMKTVESKDGQQHDIKAEESIKSREFWMFIGSLVLLFSAVLITGATSLPVWNKLVQVFNPDYVGAALKDPVAHHNRYQLVIGLFIGLLSGIAQFMRYNERNWTANARKFGIHMLIGAVLAAIMTALNATWIDMNAWQMYALMFAGMFALSSNADYIVSVLKGNIKLAGSALSHAGFGLLILGIMSTGLNKEWVSSNPFAMEGLIEGVEGDELGKNVLLLKGAAMPMKGNLEATYEKDTIVRQTRTFSVRFKKRDNGGNYTGEEFLLHPNVMYDREFTKVVASNPSTQHYWNYDIFTHVSSLPKAELDPEFAKAQEDTLKYVKYEAIPGDTIFTQEHFIVVDDLTKQPQHPDYKPKEGDMAFGLKLRVGSLEDKQPVPAVPAMYIRPGEGAFSLPYVLTQQQVKLRLTEASMEKILKTEDALQFSTIPMKEGGTFTYKGFSIRFVRADREVKHPNYSAQEGDIAVAAVLEVLGHDGSVIGQAQPVYLIRGSQPFSLKDEIPSLGLHFRFEGIDPKEGILNIGVAQATAEQRSIPVEIAENVARSDYIVLEAIIFPGINFVWLGSLLMLFGLALSLWNRMSSRL